TTGFGNIAIGQDACNANQSANSNTGVGWSALSNNTGSTNTAVGSTALFSNTTGHDNMAEGFEALANNKRGSTKITLRARGWINLNTGRKHIDIGGPGTAAEANAIRIGKSGTQKKTFIAGIFNVNDGGTIKPVYVNNNGQLGTQPPASSARFKKEIKVMDKV